MTLSHHYEVLAFFRWTEIFPPALGSNWCPLSYEPKISPVDHQGTHVHTHTHKHTHAYTYTQTQTHTRIYTHTHKRTHKHAHAGSLSQYDTVWNGTFFAPHTLTVNHEHWIAALRDKLSCVIWDPILGGTVLQTQVKITLRLWNFETIPLNRMVSYSHTHTH